MRHPALAPIRKLRASAGFTLVELIIVIVLLGILAVVGSNMLSDSFTSTRMVNASNGSEAEARYAMERMAREIREIRYSSGYAISTANSSVLQFVNGSGGNVRIALVGTDLKLDYTSTTTSTNTLVSGVSSFSLAYFDVNNQPLTALGMVSKTHRRSGLDRRNLA